MTYTYSLPSGDGFIGIVCCDPDCECPLHESSTERPTRKAAEFVALCEWIALTLSEPSHALEGA